MKNIYQQHGYENRQDYLASLAKDNGVDISIVFFTADLLGEDEDFDGLVSEIQDFPLL